MGDSVVRQIRRVMRHPDTSRTIQGAVMVAQELMRAGVSNKGQASTAPASMAQGLAHVASHFAGRAVGNAAGSATDAAVAAVLNLPNEKDTNAVSIPDDNDTDGTRVKQAATASARAAYSSLGPSDYMKDDSRVADKDSGLATAAPEFDPSLQTERAVPSSQVARVLGFGQLGVSLALGSVGEAFRRGVGAGRDSSSTGSQQAEQTVAGVAKDIVLSDANSERIAATLCRMRGAALKLGQMLSIQDEDMLPPQLSAALERVRQNADIMPSSQLENAMRTQLGPEWRALFSTFNDRPFAAASLGQVHAARMADTEVPVAVKVQFPGVAESIDSDLLNLKRLASVTGIFPRGLYIDRIIEVMKGELSEECDYVQEAKYQTRFRELLMDDKENFFVPRVIPEASTSRVLTSELARGVPIDKALEKGLSQETRNRLGRNLLRLTLRELLEFRLMQTDPNFSNYLYDDVADRLVLLDFGATREYGEGFIDDYIELVWAASNSDRTGILDYSIKLGFLTGEESREMVNAHIEAGLEVGRPFQRNAPFDFCGSKIAQQMGKHGDTFLNERLTPPPMEIYSLHRKLSGAYMTCIKIGAVFPCRDLLEQSYQDYQAKKAPRESHTSLTGIQ